MKVNIKKIDQIYGKYVLDQILCSKDNFSKNVKYFISLGFDDVEDIIERCTPLFLYDFEDFKEKIDSLINRLGSNYIEEVESDLDLLEELL